MACFIHRKVRVLCFFSSSLRLKGQINLFYIFVQNFVTLISLNTGQSWSWRRPFFHGSSQKGWLWIHNTASFFPFSPLPFSSLPKSPIPLSPLHLSPNSLHFYLLPLPLPPLSLPSLPHLSLPTLISLLPILCPPLLSPSFLNMSLPHSLLSPSHSFFFPFSFTPPSIPGLWICIHFL